MSRLAKKTILIPEHVAFTLSDHPPILLARGPKGEVKVPVLLDVGVEIQNNVITVKRQKDTKQGKMNVGTMWSLVQNAISGVVSGFSKILEIEGVGYRAAVEGDHLVLSLGYVMPVRFKIPEGITIGVSKNTITVSGIEKELVGRTAAQIRNLKKPEPYKGKGIRYRDEVIRRKAGKKTVAAGS